MRHGEIRVILGRDERVHGPWVALTIECSRELKHPEPVAAGQCRARWVIAKLGGSGLRVNSDFTSTMVQELDEAAKELNVSRQAVIVTFVRRALDQHYLAKKARIAS